jgi:uncharacterized protein YecE (DUF72 family)
MTLTTVRIGPAGWSYSDWEGTVYPPHKSRFDHLSYLAGFFDTIEVNSSFYRIPPPTHATSWVRRVAFNRDFRFTAKSYRGFTHDAAPWTDGDVTAYRHFLDPLQAAGRLGAVLHQFPWSFKRTDETMDRLARLFDAFTDYPQVVEVRHATFAHDEFFTFLRDRAVGFANVDQPLFSDSVKPSAIVTGPVAYARFHGRNYQKWFAHEESWERYNYLYSKEELEPWADRIRVMSKANDVYAITNNHFRGQAVVNAVELERELGLAARLPPQVEETYPERFAGATFDSLPPPP